MRKIFPLLILAPLWIFPVRAQEKSKDPEKDPQKLQYEITVTAERQEIPVTQTATAVTVVTREELELLKKITVLEALEDVCGFSFTRNGPQGSASSAQIRGANSEHTKVMLDGMELNDPMTPGRTFDMSLLLINNIERIEIIRGPQSTLYGSDAMGGVINIISRQKTGRPHLSLSAQGGSYGAVSSSLGLSGSTETVSYTLGASYLNHQGFSAAGDRYQGNIESDGSRNLTLAGKLGFRLRNNLEINLGLRSIRSKVDIDNFGGDFGDDPNNVQNYDAQLFNAGARGLFLRNRWESKLNLSYLTYDRQQENPVDDIHPFDSDRSRFQSSLVKLDWQNNIFAHPSSTVTGGVELSREEGESEYNSESQWGPFASLFPKKSARNVGLYLQDRIQWSGRLFAALGLRYDHHSHAGGAFTFRLAPAFLISETGTRLKATLGTGFKSPSLYQLFAPATLFGPVGNEELEPERSLSWETGIEQNLWQDKVLLGALYFSNRFDNLIDYDYFRGYINIGQASTQGLEMFVRTHPLSNLIMGVEYTRMKARDEDSGDTLLRRPKHKISARFHYSFLKKGSLALNLIYIGEREDEFWSGLASERVTLASYTLLNAALGYDILPYMDAFVRVDNLLDQRYEAVKGYGTPGLSIYGGLRLKY
jgi:vitamin B12 transporter